MHRADPLHGRLQIEECALGNYRGDFRRHSISSVSFIDHDHARGLLSGFDQRLLVKRPHGPWVDHFRADVIFFDPGRDVAVLHVPGYTVTGVTFGPAQRGTQGAVIGYPGGRSESTVAAVVDGTIAAQGRDIYNSGFVTRQIYVLQASVHPGNSGGPLIDLQGRVLGMVFATSASDPSQAYALTDDEISSDISEAAQNPKVTNTEKYECAA